LKFKFQKQTKKLHSLVSHGLLLLKISFYLIHFEANTKKEIKVQQTYKKTWDRTELHSILTEFVYDDGAVLKTATTKNSVSAIEKLT
jgi:hypothetical protein